MRLLAGLCTLMAALPLESSGSDPAKPQRGVWFWQGGSSPFGSTAIVGDPLKENQTLAFFESHGITKVYGSYGNRTTTPEGAAEVAAWNVKLHAAGLESQILMSNNLWIFPEKHPDMLTGITQRLIEFNNAPGRLPEEKFDGLHLDIEPQGLDADEVAALGKDPWNILTDAQKRDYVVLLFQMYGVVRGHIDTGLGAGFPIWGDLPVWFDSLTSSIGWTDAAERDLWYGQAQSDLTGIVLMAFAQDTFSGIDSSVSWEFANVTAANLRVALRATFGTGAQDDWPTPGNFLAMRDDLETAYGFERAIDIQDYVDYREAFLSLPAESVLATLSLPPGSGIAILELHAKPDFVHFIQASADLCRWRSVHSFQTDQEGIQKIELPLERGARRGFWQILRYPVPLPGEGGK